MSIEKAWENVIGLDYCLTPGTSHEGCVAGAARDLAEEVLAEALALEQYTCHTCCDHREECRTTRRAALRDRIQALGSKE